MKRPLLGRTFTAMVVLAITATAAQPAFATCGGGGGGGMGGLNGGKIFDVPWKRISKRNTDSKAGMTLYWMPVSTADYNSSPLRVSRVLSLFSGRCVDMCVADLKTPVGEELCPDATHAPAVVLCQRDGTVLNKLEGTKWTVADVEALLKSEVAKQREAMRAKLEAARGKAEAGDKEGAISDLRAILEHRCLVPQLAKQAQNELKKLGVDDVSEIPAEPIFDKAVGEKMRRILLSGLRKEETSDYAGALSLYMAAHKLDPQDPVPLRFLAELYRHDIGDWDEATRIYKQILSMESDPLSRAVAMHGLGKITIHNGEFIKGEQLMEQSLQVYPLALTCRNLAVYWNSEGDSTKCNYYIDEALKLAPNDPFNRVFAAVFMAGNGRRDEALSIARDHENLLPASYNLAAIYAQAGMKDKALALLKRHFYEYERNDAVRAEEMMEARVDRVFDSLVKDKDFLALTSKADGKLPMRGMTAH